MLRRILVPLDGSALAEAALPAARAIARLTGARVTLVQAVEPAETLDDVGDPLAGGLALELQATDDRIAIYRVVDAHAADYLAGVAGRLAPDGIAARTQVVAGPAAVAIVEAAREADLIVMATHGRGGLGRWAIGSVADKVTQGAPAPVLLVRAEQAQPLAAGYPRRILVPLDGSDLAERALPLAMQLAARAEAEVILTHVVAAPDGPDGDAAEGPLGLVREQARAYLHEVSQRLVEPGATLHTDVRVGPAAEGILAAADARRADLIAMSTHGRGGLGRWVYGSIADRIVRSAGVPVLVVRADVASGAPPWAEARRAGAR
jgi:nucleotide-binding universal stress UspA family protein